MLKVESVTKTYRSGTESVRALKDVSLTLNREDFVSIVGPSGAGKSTLLHVMGGLDPPSSGRVEFEGRDIYRMRDDQRSLWLNKTVGFVFQFYHLIEELNVLENVALAAFTKARKSSLKSAQLLLQYLEIADRKSFFPSQLSGGERQKVAIARALINEPQIILCDEPTGNLDVDSQDKVLYLLGKLNKDMKKTIVLVTHNLELAKQGQRIIKLEAGEVK